MKIKELESLLSKAAQKYVSKEEADYFAKLQISTHLKKFPRSNPLKTAISDLESWAKNQGNKMEVQADKGASLLLNFNKLGPSLKIKMVHDELEKRAKEHGIAMIGINNSHGIHTLDLWTDSLANRDLMSICFYNGGPSGVIPHSGTKGIFGTNPMSYSIPTNEKPATTDMATSEIPFFEILNAKKNGEQIRKNTAVNNTGEITTDPNEAMANDDESNLLPMGGGYKGYNLVYLLEVLTGSLVGSSLSTEMTPGYVREEHGGLIIAFDISVFNKANKFKDSVQKMNEIVRSQKPRAGVEKLIVPGDRGNARSEEILKQDNIDVSEELIKKLELL
jgi:ureidoglycolate dehydrogenase (NAD+)